MNGLTDGLLFTIPLTRNMEWDKHIRPTKVTEKTKKPPKCLGSYAEISAPALSTAFVQHYIARVRPSLEYGASARDPFLTKDVNKLERAQHRAARFITRDHRSKEKGCVSEMLSTHETPSLKTRRKEIRTGIIYKAVNSELPAFPPSHFLTPAKGPKTSENTETPRRLHRGYIIYRQACL